MIDHLIPLELDGSNSIKDLWPSLIEPRLGMLKPKDSLEEQGFMNQVCSTGVSVERANGAVFRFARFAPPSVEG